VAPIDVRRVHPTENTNEIATEQVKRLLRELPERAGAHDEAPLFVFDAGDVPQPIVRPYFSGRTPRARQPHARHHAYGTRWR
jgi:hypothetical protein